MRTRSGLDYNQVNMTDSTSQVALSENTTVLTVIKRRVKPPKYAENIAIDVFLEAFERAREINEWEDKEAAAELCNALEGPAKLIAFQAVDSSYQVLKDLLRKRLSDQGAKLYRTFQEDPRVYGDTLYDIYDNTKRIIRRVYGDYLQLKPALLLEQELACFLRSLPTASLADAVAFGNPENLEEALELALKSQLRRGDYDSRRNRTKPAKLRQMVEEDSDGEETSDSTPKWLDALQQQMTEVQLLATRAIQVATEKKPEKTIACYLCGAENHLAAGCLLKKSRPNTNRQNGKSSSRKYQNQGNE